MNRSRIAVAAFVLARILAASFCVVVLLAPNGTKSLADPGPAAAGPAEAPPPSAAPNPGSKPVAHQPPTASQAQPGMQLVRQVLSPSGKLRIQYMRDREQGLRQIALQDASNPANTTVLAHYQRNAWVVVSPDDQLIVFNNRDGAEGGVQLYHRVSTAPLKYEVPQELRSQGAALQDVVWKNYLSDTQQDPGTARNHVTIDGISWEPDSHRVSLSVAPIPSKSETALPEPWTCSYDVTSQQIVPPTDVAEGPADAAPGELTEAPAEGPATADADANAAAPAEAATDFEGEKFPATREEPITVEDANELELSDIRYAINEMLARHGANFHDVKIRKTFSKFSWYQPRTDVSEKESKNEFSDVEKNNIAVLRRCRDAKIAAARRRGGRSIGQFAANRWTKMVNALCAMCCRVSRMPWAIRSNRKSGLVAAVCDRRIARAHKRGGAHRAPPRCEVAWCSVMLEMKPPWRAMLRHRRV